jgi:hypothetical protein
MQQLHLRRQHRRMPLMKKSSACASRFGAKSVEDLPDDCEKVGAGPR